MIKVSTVEKKRIEVDNYADLAYMLKRRKSRICHVATDIDDTLVQNGSPSLPSDILEIASDMNEQGIGLSLVTGRSHRRTMNIIASLQANNPSSLHAVANGARIVGKNNHTIVFNELSADIAKTALEVVNTFSNKMVVYLPGAKRALSASQTKIGAAVQALYIPVTASQEQDLRAQLEDSLQDEVGIYASDSPPHVSEGFRMLNVGHPKANKEAALRSICKLSGIDICTVAALDDGENGIPMLQAAGTSIVVANAVPGALEEADFVIPSVYDGGAAIALYAIAHAVSERSL